MKVAKDKVVTIDYTLKDDSGNVLDTSEARGPLAYIHGSGSLIPGLETQMEGKNPGDSLHADVTPEQAYGEYNPQLIFDVSRETFENPDQIEAGMQFQARMNDEIHLLTVKEVKPDVVTVDANHPLAGQELHFDVNIVDVRDASQDELQHGHVHEGEE